MQNDEINKLLRKAKQKMYDMDVIVSGYDLTFQWISTKLSKIIGYDVSEIIDKATVSLQSYSQEEARKIELEIYTALQDVNEEIPVKTKKGEIIKIKFKIRRITYEKEPYMVGKILKVIK